jgi:haloalkane dehalogenase
MVFLHGFGGGSSAYEWSKVYPAFAADYRVIAPDLPGWGASGHPQRDYCTEDYLGAIALLLEELCPHPAWVVASSLTGAMAIRVAIAHPERVRGLILVAPAGLKDFGAGADRALLESVVRVPLLDTVLYQGAIATREGIAQFLERQQFADPQRITPEIIDAYYASAQQPNAAAAALAFVRGDLSFDLAPYLAQLTTPTAVLWGEAARLTEVDLGRRLVALAPQAIRHFQVLPGIGLTPQLEQPSTTIAAIRHSLRVLSKPRVSEDTSDTSDTSASGSSISSAG